MSGIAVTCWTIRLTLSVLLKGQGGVFIFASPVPHNLWIKLNRTVIFLFILWQGAWDWTATIFISSDPSACYFSFIFPNTHHLELLYLSCFCPAKLNRWHIGRDRANKYEWVEITWQRVSFPSNKSSSFSIVHQPWSDGLWKLNQHLLLQPGLLDPAKELKAFCKKMEFRGMLKTVFLPASPPTITLSVWMVHTVSSLLQHLRVTELELEWPL